MLKGRPKKVEINADSEWGENRQLARVLLIKSRLYRYFALAFALLGVVIFIFLYFRHIEGNLLQALQSPSIIPIIVLPFLPAFVLSLLAQRLERQFAKLGKSAEEDTAKADVPPAPKKK